MVGGGDLSRPPTIGEILSGVLASLQLARACGSEWTPVSFGESKVAFGEPLTVVIGEIDGQVLDLAVHYATEGKAVAIFSERISLEDIAICILARMSLVSSEKFLSPKISNEKWQRVTSMAQVLSGLPISVCNRKISWGKLSALIVLRRAERGSSFQIIFTDQKI